jgi:hypothetical protein
MPNGSTPCGADAEKIDPGPPEKYAVNWAELPFSAKYSLTEELIELWQIETTVS